MPPIVDDREPPASLHDALESLEKASRTPAKQRAVKVSGVIDVICRHAFEDGLDDDTLRTVVHVASRKTELDQTSVTTLVKNLYPAQRVPADVVVTVVGALGQGKGKPSPGSQNGLVKWLAIVHEIIEDPNILSRLYGVLFGMLDMISIRTSLCHLLSLITRRKHVKPFRIQQLLEYSRSLGNEPALQGLLRIYKDYYPDIILGTTSTNRHSFPPRPDPEWRTRILAIQEWAAAVSDSTLEQPNGFKVLRKGPKRTKVSLIPDVHTYHTNEASVTLEGIDNVQDFVEKLDRIEPPGQLISFLTDPLLQKYVDLRPSPITSRRIELWLSTCLEEQYNTIKDGTGDSQYLSEILDGFLKHAQYTKVLPQLVQAFLREYLLVWDGVQDVDSILGLLSYIPLQPFHDTYTAFLRLAERAIIANSSPEAYERLLGLYTSLLRHWAVQTPPRPPPPGFALDDPNQRIFADLSEHVSQLSLSLLLSTPPTDATLLSKILTFYEVLSTCSTPYHVPILLPPSHLLYLLTLTPSTTALDRTAGIIAACKTAFNNHPGDVKDYYSKDALASMNCSLRDFYHFIWISRALSTGQNALGLHCYSSLRDTLNTYLSSLDHQYAIQTAFNVSHNPWLASLSAAAWRELEERKVREGAFDRRSVEWHRGPVSSRSLEVLGKNGGVDVGWEAYRVEVFKWLEGRGVGGLKGYIFAASTEEFRRRYGEEV
ncbi:Mis6-domain-containing protein [Lentithecium fluviatile CBS 122367]|uniref:Mis6-domain-containing protein n=1 Tax=Lentithecium fluviatile CBS 122367 TaxID=1168545 RepID=A0A6G1JFE7_9PLEO|nr:Mis6-domain-containing protein [Lentithecium fluviatile CBS 122367]